MSNIINLGLLSLFYLICLGVCQSLLSKTQLLNRLDMSFSPANSALTVISRLVICCLGAWLAAVFLRACHLPPARCGLLFHLLCPLTLCFRTQGTKGSSVSWSFWRHGESKRDWRRAYRLSSLPCLPSFFSLAHSSLTPISKGQWPSTFCMSL